MKTRSKTEALDLFRGFLEALRERPKFYTLNHLTAGIDGVTNDSVNEMAKTYADDGEVRALYNKVKDILELRLIEACNAGNLDRGIAQSGLKSFYSWDSKDKVQDDVHVVEISIVYPEKSTPTSPKGGKKSGK